MHAFLRKPAFAALITAVGVAPLQAQDPQAALDHLRELALDSVVASSTVYFRPADRERALLLQAMLDEFLGYWNARLGLQSHLRLAVLSPDDWQKLTRLPYGFPNSVGPPADLILAASMPPAPTGLDTLLIDGARDGRDWLIVGHEGGHLLNWALLPAHVLALANERTQTDTAAQRRLRRIDGIPKWFWEYSASYFLTAFLDARHPAAATAWTGYLEALARPPAPRYSHLDDWFGEFMSAQTADGSPYFLSGDGAANFGWYQGVAGLLGAHVIPQGDAGIAHIRRTIAGDAEPTTALLLTELESIAPGVRALAERLGAGYRERDESPAAATDTARTQDTRTGRAFPMTDAWRAAVTDTIRSLVAASAGANFFRDCASAGDAAWLPDEAPLVHFAAEDRVIRLESSSEIVAYCQRIAQGRASTEEEVEEQTVHLLTHDVAYVVTRSTQTTRWQEGRTEVRPVVETAIAARQGNRWRIIYKHLSWGESGAEAR